MVSVDRSGVFILFGVILLAVGALGGGFEVKEIKIPRVGPFSRIFSALLGAILMVIASPLVDVPDAGKQPAGMSAAAATSPPAAATAQPTAAVQATATAAPPSTQSSTAAAVQTKSGPTRQSAGGSSTASFKANVWDFSYVVVSNTCGSGPGRGEMLQGPLGLFEAYPADGYISDGETLAVLDAQGNVIGTPVLNWPIVTFSAPFRGGYEIMYIEFFNDSSGWSRLELHEPSRVGECTMVAEEPRPIGFVPTFEKRR